MKEDYPIDVKCPRHKGVMVNYSQPCICNKEKEGKYLYRVILKITKEIFIPMWVEKEDNTIFDEADKIADDYYEEHYREFEVEVKDVKPYKIK